MRLRRGAFSSLVVAIVASAASAEVPGANHEPLIGPPGVISDCAEQLTRLGVKYSLTALPLAQKIRSTYTCGVEQAVVFQRGPEGVRYNASPLVSCSLALALAHFERVLEEEAVSHFGKRVVRIQQGGTYSCRKMVRFQNLVSEHSYANAIDVHAFVLSDGRRISVLQDFGRIDREPPTPRGRFLRRLARRLYDERVFSVVLTPYWDALHRDHLHLDMARYRVDGTR